MKKQQLQTYLSDCRTVFTETLHQSWRIRNIYYDQMAYFSRLSWDDAIRPAHFAAITAKSAYVRYRQYPGIKQDSYVIRPRLLRDVRNVRKHHVLLTEARFTTITGKSGCVRYCKPTGLGYRNEAVFLRKCIWQGLQAPII